MKFTAALILIAASGVAGKVSKEEQCIIDSVGNGVTDFFGDGGAIEPCFYCKAAMIHGDGTKTVILDFKDCKSGDISWICCTGSDGGQNGGTNVETGVQGTNCGIADTSPAGSGDAAPDKNKINGVGGVMHFLLPEDAQTIDLETHDGQWWGSSPTMTGQVCSGGQPGQLPGQGGSCAKYSPAKTAILAGTFDLGDCGAGAETFGDPHFKSWDGQYFDYMGECDLVLADSPSFGEGLGLSTHIRSKARYDYTYIESAAVKIGDDVLEVTAFGDYMFNGVSKAPMPVTMAGKYTVTQAIKNDHDVTFEIQTGKHESIFVKAFKDLVSVRFDNAHLADAKGIMGDFKTGAHVGRDGVTVMANADEFGQEWQVNPDVDGQIFQTKSKIQYPAEKCMMPSTAKTGRRRLGETISVEAATKACEKLGNEDAIAACVYDVIALGDLEAAESGVF